MCISHPLFPLIKYIPFAPTRGLLSCKSIYTGESLFIDYKIRIIKSVKWSGISLTAGFKMVKIFIYRKYLKLILQVFMSPSESCFIELILITAGDNTQQEMNNHFSIFFKAMLIYFHQWLFSFYMKQQAW